MSGDRRIGSLSFIVWKGSPGQQQLRIGSHVWNLHTLTLPLFLNAQQVLWGKRYTVGS